MGRKTPGVQRYKVVVFPDAYQDIDHIRDYIINSFQDPIAANRTVDRIVDQIDSLELMPRRRKVGNKVYAVKAGNYNVFYFIKRRTVYVTHVIYIRRLTDF